MRQKKLIFIFNSRFAINMQVALDFFRRQNDFQITVLDEHGTYFNTFLASKMEITLFRVRNTAFSEALNQADFIFVSFIQEMSFVFDDLESARPQIINLWHGFPVRSMGMLSPMEAPLLETVLSKPLSKSIIVHHIVPSDFFRDIFEDGFSGLRNKIWPFGSIRFQSIRDENVHARFLVKNLFHDRDIQYVIMYTPTHSLAEGQEISIWDDFQGEILNEFLVTNRIMLLIKQHDGRSVKVPGDSNIVELDTSALLASGIYTQHLFRYVDLLIADVSSLVVDFLLMNKPLIFNQVSSEYIGRSGGYSSNIFFDAGHRVVSQDQATRAILEALTSDPFRERRKSVIEQIYAGDRGEVLANIHSLVSKKNFFGMLSGIVFSNR